MKLFGPIDAKEIARLLDGHSAALALYASQWSKSPEDSVQNAFLSLARQTTRPENIVAWLYRVVRNEALNENRSQRRRLAREQTAAENIANQNGSVKNDPANLTQQHDEHRKLIRVLRQLEPTERELVTLRIWSELTWKEIAELTALSSSSAHRAYESALVKLKTKMETKCLTP